MKRFSTCLLLLMLLNAGPSVAELRKVTFIPQWIPQAQFAGYYMTYEKGFYRKQGMEVTILRGGPDRSACKALEQGKADFSTMMLSDALQERARGLKMVNLAQIVQRSAYILVAKRERGIVSPADLQGCTVGLWGEEFQVQARTFFNKYSLKVRVVPQSTTMNLFLRDGVDAASAMWYNGYHAILNSGYDPEELTTFFLFEHELNFPEDGIYCLEKTFRADPAQCRAFASASIEGWRYAFAHPEETLDIVMRYAEQGGNPTNRPHQKWMLARMRDICLPKDINLPMGALAPADYARVERLMLEHGVVGNVPPLEHFFKGGGDAK